MPVPGVLGILTHQACDAINIPILEVRKLRQDQTQ